MACWLSWAVRHSLPSLLVTEKYGSLLAWLLLLLLLLFLLLFFLFFLFFFLGRGVHPLFLQETPVIATELTGLLALILG